MIRWRTLSELSTQKGTSAKEVLEDSLEAGESIFASLPKELVLYGDNQTTFPYVSDGIIEIPRFAAAMLAKHEFYKVSKVVITIDEGGSGGKEYFLSEQITIGLDAIRLKKAQPNLAPEFETRRFPSLEVPPIEWTTPPPLDRPLREAKEASQPWIANAKLIAKKLLKERPLLKNQSALQIAGLVEKEMTKLNQNGEAGMTGRGNRVPEATTIKRHALKGIKNRGNAL